MYSVFLFAILYQSSADGEWIMAGEVFISFLDNAHGIMHSSFEKIYGKVVG